MPRWLEKFGREAARLVDQAQAFVEENKLEREVNRVGHQLESLARDVKAEYQDFNKQHGEGGSQSVPAEANGSLANSGKISTLVQGAAATAVQTEPALTSGPSVPTVQSSGDTGDISLPRHHQ